MHPETSPPPPNDASKTGQEQKQPAQIQASSQKAGTEKSTPWSTVGRILKNPAFWQMLSTLAIAAFTGLLVVTSTAQWRATRAAVDAANKNADAAMRMAETAQEANRIARENALINIRPWIGWLAKSANVEAGHTPSIILEYKNYGNSPAVFVDVRHAIGTADRTLEAPEAIEEINALPSNPVSTIFPGMTIESPQTFPKQFTAEDMEKIRAGKRKMFLLGKITYQDTAGGQHHSWIQTEYSPKVNCMIHKRIPGWPPDD